MTKILAIDTSTQACSCALYLDGVTSEVFDIIPRQHAGELLPMITALMQEHDTVYADLDAVAYGRGPGSFTGLRIASGVSQGIAFAADLPVIPVSTLASIAFQLSDCDNVEAIFSTLDARIDEVYWGLYNISEGKPALLGEEGLCKPELLPVAFSGIDSSTAIAGAGSGIEFLDRMPECYSEWITVQRPDIYPRAGAIAELAVADLQKGLYQAPEEVCPVYLRDKVAHSKQDN